MIKAFWFMLKIAALVALVVWLADRPGEMRMEWIDLNGDEFVVNMQIGLFLAGLVGVILLSIFVFQVIKTFVDFPKSLARYNEVKAREKGYKALTVGLSAVAAGDTAVAVKQAKKVRSLLPNDTGLPLLLDAQAARLDGREVDAAQHFVALLEDKDASFLGVRGLLQASLDAGDRESALKLAEKAIKSHPKQLWVLKIAYKLKVQLSEWEDAQKLLKKLISLNGFDAENAAQEKAALLTAQGLGALEKNYDIYAEESFSKALKADAGFVPALEALSQYFVERDENKKAVRAIEKAWKAKPHDLQVTLWMNVQDAKKVSDPLERLRWLERLIKFQPKQAAARIAAGEAAVDAGLWGEAREHFRVAEELEPSADLYKALARLEEQTSNDEQVIKELLEKAMSAPSERCWVCRETAQIFEGWQPFSGFDRTHFNSLEWKEPYATSPEVLTLEQPAVIESVIEAPKTDAA